MALDLRRIGSLMRREPLVHFVALATLLFAIHYIWSSIQKERIVVDQQTADFLIKQREDLELRKLTPEERQETIEGYIEDEILYREAYKRGLDKEARMRRNLILKMRGLALGEINKPTEGELKAYFQANRAKFRRPATLSFDHIFYRDPLKVPDGFLMQLQAGRDHKALGDIMPGLGGSLPNMSARELANLFGPDTARAILALTDDQWHGPFESSRGIHFVRIVGRSPARDARYDEIKSFLAQDWALAQSRGAIEKEVERLRGNYEIVVEAEGLKP
ncbi:MAG: peptidyl-prolyl cis-trans isomerase [Alphaproteobacteria bacterium]